MSGDTFTRPDFRAAKVEPVVARPAGRRRAGRRPTSCGPSATQLATEAVRPGRVDLRRARAGRPARHHHARPGAPGDRREVGQGSRHGSRIAAARPDPANAGRPPRRRSASIRIPAWMRNLDGQGRPQRRARRARLPDRRAGHLRRVGRLLLDGRQRPSSSRSTTSSARATASRAPRSSRSTTPSASTTRPFTAGDMLMDVATDFGGGYTPTNADNLERGPVRVRNALQFSLNIPSVKAMAAQHARARVRPGQGLRDELPERHDRRRR